MRSLIIVAFLGVCATVAFGATLPFSFGQIPDQLREIVPKEVTDFYASLTEQDKTDLKEIAQGHSSYENEEQALEALKGKNEKLYTKAIELRDLLKTKIASLEKDAKTFVEEMISKVRALKPKGDEKPDIAKIRGVANEVITQYKALSEAAKTNLQETFPQITGVLKNEKFQSIAQGLIKDTPN